MTDDNRDAVDDDRWVTVDPDADEHLDQDDEHDDEGDGGEALRVDPDAPGRSLFDDGDAVEPNEPG